MQMNDGAPQSLPAVLAKQATSMRSVRDRQSTERCTEPFAPGTIFTRFLSPWTTCQQYETSFSPSGNALKEKSSSLSRSVFFTGTKADNGRTAGGIEAGVRPWASYTILTASSVALSNAVGCAFEEK